MSSPGSHRYQGEFTLTKAGAYSMTVLLNNIPLKSSPLSFNISPSSLSPKDSIATGTALTTVSAGSENQVTIQGYDKYENMVTVGGADLHKSSITSNPSHGTTQLKVTDLKNGTYHVNYTLEHAGEYEFNVKMNDASVKGSPFALHVSAGSLSPAHSTASGSGLSSATAGLTATASVHAKDQYNNPLSSGGATCAVTLTPPTLAEQAEQADTGAVGAGECKDEKNGLYTVTYRLTNPTGSYSLDIQLESKVTLI